MVSNSKTVRDILSDNYKLLISHLCVQKGISHPAHLWPIFYCDKQSCAELLLRFFFQGRNHLIQLLKSGPKLFQQHGSSLFEQHLFKLLLLFQLSHCRDPFFVEPFFLVCFSVLWVLYVEELPNRCWFIAGCRLCFFSWCVLLSFIFTNTGG